MLIQVFSQRFELTSPYLQSKNSVFLLMQDGVYILPHLLSLIDESESRRKVFVLDTDLAASGLAHQAILKDKAFTEINADKWIALCVDYHNIITVQD